MIRRFLAPSILAVVFVCPITTFAEVHFSQLTFAEAQNLAQKQKKSVMIDFYTDWCGWCKVLDRMTYSNKKVGEYADEHFISIKIDAEKGDGVALAKKYSVSAYPTILFVAADGSLLNRVVGYQDTGAFERSMLAAAAGGEQGLLEKTKTKAGASDPTTWLALAEYYASHDKEVEAHQTYERVMQLDASNKKKCFEQALYGKAFVEDTLTRPPALLDAYHKYPDCSNARRAVETLIMWDLNHGMNDEAGMLVDEWGAKHPEDAEMFNMFAWEAAERNVLLDRAEDLATRAVAQYTDLKERANALDTKAEVVAKEGRPNDAVIFETQALMLLTPADKHYKEFTERKAKFQAASNPASQAIEPR